MFLQLLLASFSGTLFAFSFLAGVAIVSYSFMKRRRLKKAEKLWAEKAHKLSQEFLSRFESSDSLEEDDQ